MLKVEIGQGEHYGPSHDIRIAFDVEFSDKQQGMLCLYYPTIDIALVNHETEITQVRSVINGYSLEDYKDFVQANCLCFVRMSSNLKELASHFHQWERELWSLGPVRI